MFLHQQKVSEILKRRHNYVTDVEEKTTTKQHSLGSNQKCVIYRTNGEAKMEVCANSPV